LGGVSSTGTTQPAIIVFSVTVMLENIIQMINIEPAECTPALIYKVAVLAVADPPFARFQFYYH
jgi:hypothetical protein